MEEGVGLAAQGVSKCVQSTLRNWYKELLFSYNNMIDLYLIVHSVPPLFVIFLYLSVFCFCFVLFFFRICKRLSTPKKKTHLCYLEMTLGK